MAKEDRFELTVALARISAGESETGKRLIDTAVTERDDQEKKKEESSTRKRARKREYKPRPKHWVNLEETYEPKRWGGSVGGPLQKERFRLIPLYLNAVVAKLQSWLPLKVSTAYKKGGIQAVLFGVTKNPFFEYRSGTSLVEWLLYRSGGILTAKELMDVDSKERRLETKVKQYYLIQGGHAEVVKGKWVRLGEFIPQLWTLFGSEALVQQFLKEEFLVAKNERLPLPSRDKLEAWLKEKALPVEESLLQMVGERKAVVDSDLDTVSQVGEEAPSKNKFNSVEMGRLLPLYMDRVLTKVRTWLPVKVTMSAKRGVCAIWFGIEWRRSNVYHSFSTLVDLYLYLPQLDQIMSVEEFLKYDATFLKDPSPRRHGLFLRCAYMLAPSGEWVRLRNRLPPLTKLLCDEWQVNRFLDREISPLADSSLPVPSQERFQLWLRERQDKLVAT